MATPSAGDSVTELTAGEFVRRIEGLWRGWRHRELAHSRVVGVCAASCPREREDDSNRDVEIASVERAGPAEIPVPTHVRSADYASPRSAHRDDGAVFSEGKG